MNQKQKQRNSQGRFEKGESPPMVKKGITLEAALYNAVDEYSKLLGISFSAAISQLANIGLETEGFEGDPAFVRIRPVEREPSAATNVNAPVNARSNDSSAVVLGNANTTTISKKSRSQRGHLPRERE